MVSIDTLRADHMGHYGYTRKTTPHIDDFAKRSVVFNHAYSQMSHTLPSHVSLLTSLYPDTHGVIKMEDSLSRKIETFAEILEKNGYETAAFLNAGWLHPKFGLRSGFKTYNYYHDLTVIEESGKNIVGRNAEETNAAVFSWLRKSHQAPFFLFVHYFDVHSDWERLPYESPPPYETMFTAGYDSDFNVGPNEISASQYLMKLNREGVILEDKDRGFMEALYDGGIAYTDHHVGILLKTLEDMGLLEKSIVIIISDHGEEFQEHGMLLHEQVYEEHVRVPLIMKFPEVSEKNIKAPVQLIDIMPTVLDYLNVTPPKGLQGKSLMAILEGKELEWNPVYSRNASGTQYSIIQGRWKLILKNPSGETLLFDLGSDPLETNDLSGMEHDKAASLKKQLFQWMKLCQERSAEYHSQKVEIDKSTMDELKALGYIQ